MDNPIKIIFKYKNDNRKIQYQYYIFVGPLISENIRKIFTKIQDMQFFDTLISLTEKEYDILQKKYGEYWYLYFFLSDHLTFSFKIIGKNNQKRTDIIDKYGRDWYDKHIVQNKFIKKSEYSFSAIFERDNYNTYKQQLADEKNDNEINEYRISESIINQKKESKDESKEVSKEELKQEIKGGSQSKTIQEDNNLNDDDEDNEINTDLFSKKD